VCDRSLGELGSFFGIEGARKPNVKVASLELNAYGFVRHTGCGNDRKKCKDNGNRRSLDFARDDRPGGMDAE
jgi:hypothetical protein